ncbi:hypothetical protein PInf_014866 [Phytophthora infestans]|nr:hypothetical protein PInf_014866 [Phytophthora infestans]
MWMKEKQDDWDEFLPSALCTINSSKHATHGLQPNELMMGRKLRTPAELLRRSRLEYPHNDLGTYHEALIDDLQKAQGLAALALQKEQFDHELVTHCSFLLCYYYPTHLLDEMAKDFDMALREEAITAADIDSEDDAQGRASEAEEQKTDTEEGPEPKQPEDGDEGRRQDGADGRRRYGRKRPRPSETECASESIAGTTRSRKNA